MSEEDLTREEVIKQQIAKTMAELDDAKIKNSRPQQLTRAWNDPKGFQSLAAWQNAALLRILIRKFTDTLPYKEKRLKAQLDDAARSVKRNIEEGWKRPTTSEYLQFIGYSQASLEEVKGDLRDCKTDGFLKSVPGSSLAKLGFNLGIPKGVNLRENLREEAKGIFKGKVKGEIKGDSLDKPLTSGGFKGASLNQPLTSLTVKGEPDEPGHPCCETLKSLKSESLSYEILNELANKTDWLLRKLVGSLEQKLISEKRGYEIAKAKVRGQLNWKK